MLEETKDGQLRGFADWLRERPLVADHRIPYFVRWVERFRRLSQLRGPEDWHDTLRVFLKDLGEGQTADWQIRQAADAVSLYCGQCRPRARVLPGHRGRPFGAGSC